MIMLHTFEELIDYIERNNLTKEQEKKLLKLLDDRNKGYRRALISQRKLVRKVIKMLESDPPDVLTGIKYLRKAIKRGRG